MFTWIMLAIAAFSICFFFDDKLSILRQGRKLKVVKFNGGYAVTDSDKKDSNNKDRYLDKTDNNYFWGAGPATVYSKFDTLEEARARLLDHAKRLDLPGKESEVICVYKATALCLFKRKFYNWLKGDC